MIVYGGLNATCCVLDHGHWNSGRPKSVCPLENISNLGPSLESSKVVRMVSSSQGKG